MEPALEIDTGAQTPLFIGVTDTDIRRKPWPDGHRISIFQDEGDTFYGSNLTLEQARKVRDWLDNTIYALEH